MLIDRRQFLRTATSRPAKLFAPVLAFLIVLAIGAVQIGNIPNFYSASARIWVQAASPFFNARGPEPGEIPESPLMETASNLITFCEVVTSASVLDIAYEDLQKKLPKDKLPPRVALDGVRVTPEKDANIINVSFSAADPDVAQAVVDCVVRAFMKENALQIAGPLEDTRERLQKQLELARADYNDSKNKLRNFSSATSSVNFNEEAGMLTQERMELERDCDDAQHELAALRTKVKFIQSQLGFGPGDVLAVEKISNDEEVKNLKTTISEAEVNLIQLRSKFQDQHPKVQRLKSILVDAQKEIANRYSVLIGRVDPRFEGLSADNDVQHQMLEDMLRSSGEIAAGESKLASLNRSLQELQERIALLPKKQQQFADLSRKDELATNTLSAVESEMQRIKLTESVSLSSSRLQVIDSSQNVQNMTPMFWRNAYGCAFLAAIVVAVLQLLLDPCLKSLNQLKKANLRIIGSLKKIEGDPQEAVQSADRLRLSVRTWLNRSKIIWVSSPSRGDGKSLVAYALAQSFCDAGQKVLIVDANLEHPKLHVQFGQTAAPGLCQYLHAEAEDREVVRTVRPDLYLIPAGGVTSETRLLIGNRFCDLVQRMAALFDVVIVDSAAAGVAEEHGLQLPDVHPNLLVVARIGNTIKSELAILTKQIEMMPSLSEVGLVVNGISIQRLGKLGTESGAPVRASEEGSPTVGQPVGANADW